MTAPIPEPGADVDISVDPDDVDVPVPGAGTSGVEPVLTTDPEAQRDDLLVAPENS